VIIICTKVLSNFQKVYYSMVQNNCLVISMILLFNIKNDMSVQASIAHE